MRVGKKVFAAAAPVASVMVGCLVVPPVCADEILVQNKSFESPGNIPQGFASLSADNWTMNGFGTFVNFPPYGPIPAGVGIYTNPLGGSTGHLNGVDASQAAYLFSNVGNDISQALVTGASTNVAAIFQAGHQYTLTVAAADAQSAPPGTDQLLAALYYTDGGGARHQVAQRIISSSELSQTAMTDFTAVSSVLGAGDPAVGQQINVQLTPLSNNGGQFDVDNVRVVPEPASVGLIGIGISGLLARRRSRR